MPPFVTTWAWYIGHTQGKMSSAHHLGSIVPATRENAAPSKTGSGIQMALVDYFRLEPVCYPHSMVCETFHVELRCYE